MFPEGLGNNMTAPFRPPQLSRKAQALAFIEQFLTTKGHSPTIGEIAQALGVSDTRVKSLIHVLAQERAIVRAPGAQRGISVPGLAERAAIAQLRAAGWKIDEDVRHAGPEGFPKGHLPLVAVIKHIVAPESGEGGDGYGGGRNGARAATRGAPGAGEAPTEDEGERAP